MGGKREQINSLMGRFEEARDQLPDGNFFAQAGHEADRLNADSDLTSSMAGLSIDRQQERLDGIETYKAKAKVIDEVSHEPNAIHI